MRTSLGKVVALVLVSLLVASGGALAKDKKDKKDKKEKQEQIDAAPVAFVAEGELAAPDGSGVLDAGNVRVRVREVVGDARAAWIHDRTGAASDPFAVVKEDGKPRYRTFTVEIENGGPSDVIFNSAFVALKVGDEQRFPHGFGELFDILQHSIPDEAQLSRLASVLEETPISVPPGGASHKLLVFHGVSDRKKGFILELDGLLAGLDPLPMSVRFVRPKPPK